MNKRKFKSVVRSAGASEKGAEGTSRRSGKGGRVEKNYK